MNLKVWEGVKIKGRVAIMHKVPKLNHLIQCEEIHRKEGFLLLNPRVFECLGI